MRSLKPGTHREPYPSHLRPTPVCNLAELDAFRCALTPSNLRPRHYRSKSAGCQPPAGVPTPNDLREQSKQLSAEVRNCLGLLWFFFLFHHACFTPFLTLDHPRPSALPPRGRPRPGQTADGAREHSVCRTSSISFHLPLLLLQYTTPLTPLLISHLAPLTNQDRIQ